MIKADGLPAPVCPIVFVFTGTGNVSRGAQEIFQLLPHEYVSSAQLADIVRNAAGKEGVYRNKLIGCVVNASDFFLKPDGSRITDLSAFYSNPNGSSSIFHEALAPYATVIVNGIYWDERFPRLLTKNQTKGLDKLEAICDISCDIRVPYFEIIN